MRAGSGTGRSPITRAWTCSRRLFAVRSWSRVISRCASVGNWCAPQAKRCEHALGAYFLSFWPCSSSRAVRHGDDRASHCLGPLARRHDLARRPPSGLAYVGAPLSAPRSPMASRALPARARTPQSVSFAGCVPLPRVHSTLRRRWRCAGAAWRGYAAAHRFSAESAIALLRFRSRSIRTREHYFVRSFHVFDHSLEARPRL